MSRELKPNIPNTVPILNLIDNIKEPSTAQEYIYLNEIDKLALHMLWSKSELSNTNGITLKDMLNRYDKEEYKYKLFARSYDEEFQTKEFDNVDDLMEYYNISKEDVRYLLNHSHRIYKTSKCKYYGKIKLECRIYKLNGDEYVLEGVCEKPFKYF